MTRPDAALKTAMDAPLQNLRRAVQALRPHLETPDQQAELSVIEDALARLTEDLTSTRDLLETGANQTDWKSLREGSHVLISLSGSVGALSLQAMSESLNAIAHRQDSDALATLMPPLAEELVTLIQLSRAARSPDGIAR